MSATAESSDRSPAEHAQPAGRGFAGVGNSGPVSFPSILFLDDTPPGRSPAPEAFVDLGLDQIIAGLTKDKAEYDLAPWFRSPLQSVESVVFRHEVIGDLERPTALSSAKAFASALHEMRSYLTLSEKAYYRRQKERWFLDALERYCKAVERLNTDLALLKPKSQGLSAFRSALSQYATGPVFSAVRDQAQRLESDLSSLQYVVHINGLRVQVEDYAGESDYSAEVEGVFERFQQGAVGDRSFEFRDSLDMNQVEVRILDMVAALHPEVFAALTQFAGTQTDYLDPGIARFDRELQFYISWIDHITPLRQAGLPFCLPEVSRTTKSVHVQKGFDIALAAKLNAEKAVPVTNDFGLDGPERIIVVTGPNQGGKTTFARMFGQLHYLASLGLPVAGVRAQLFLFDQIFAHFERGENTHDQRGKLQDDLIRVHEILEQASDQSVIVMNEIFTSTTLRDALALSRKVMSRMFELDLLSVWVTFIDELASLGPQTVSMVSTVEPDDPSQRTFKILRRPADGLSHALSIAERHRLTYAQIRERVAQ